MSIAGAGRAPACHLATRGRRRPVAARRGFTLIETALATIIVGVGVLAIVAAQQAFHQKNAWSTHATVAMQLGNEIREMTLNLPRHDPVTGYDPSTDTGWGPEENEAWVGDWDDLDDFDGWRFSAAEGNGPLNARRQIITNMDGWAQEITVERVDPFDITVAPASATDPYLLKFTVVVEYDGPFDDVADITTVTWIVPN